MLEGELLVLASRPRRRSQTPIDLTSLRAWSPVLNSMDLDLVSCDPKASVAQACPSGLESGAHTQDEVSFEVGKTQTCGCENTLSIYIFETTRNPWIF